MTGQVRLEILIRLRIARSLLDEAAKLARENSDLSESDEALENEIEEAILATRTAATFAKAES